MKKEEDRIISITACHIESGEEIEFYGRLFADCTGDGTIGYLAGQTIVWAVKAVLNTVRL
ncbi:FAD-dependent oxidoreductase [Bacteroides thetaiotaomicron]|nr:FAD-dependent oxidoreductase [Bacteroides thetaiotaomicron]